MNTYYRIHLYQFKKDFDFYDMHNLDNEDRPEEPGGLLKVMQFMQYDKETPGIPLNYEIENESLATKILMQNLKEVESLLLFSGDRTKKADPIRSEEELRSLINRNFEFVTVFKYKSYFEKK